MYYLTTAFIQSSNYKSWKEHFKFEQEIWNEIKHFKDTEIPFAWTASLQTFIFIPKLGIKSIHTRIHTIYAIGIHEFSGPSQSSF